MVKYVKNDNRQNKNSKLGKLSKLAVKKLKSEKHTTIEKANINLKNKNEFSRKKSLKITAVTSKISRNKTISCNIISSNKSNFKIYFEHQQNLLCGIHCVNSLLQCPYFSENDFNHFGQELDREEANLYFKRLPSLGNNIGGNYNVQILQKALQTKFPEKNIELLFINSEQAKKIILEGNDNSYIVNDSTHWFAIRKMENIWFDLNSLYKYPAIISDIDKLFESMKKKFYNLFLVTNVPNININTEKEFIHRNLLDFQRIISYDEIPKNTFNRRYYVK